MITPTSIETAKLNGLLPTWQKVVLVVGVGLCLFTFALFIAGLPNQRYLIISQSTAHFHEYAPTGLDPLGISPDMAAVYDITLDILTGGTFFLTAIILFMRRSSDQMVLLTALMLVLWGETGTVDSISNMLQSYPSNLIFVFLSGIGNALFIWFIYTFPDGKFAPKWSRWIVYVYGVWSILSSLLIAVLHLDVGAFSVVLEFLLPLSVFLIGAVVQLWRQQHYLNALQRQQVKWIVAGFTVLLTAFFGLKAFPILLPFLHMPGPPLTIYTFLYHTYLKVAIMGVPITIALSASRYRLWEVDLTINRGLVYGSLTIVLGAIFILVTVVLQLVLQRISSPGTSLVVVAFATILVGLLFLPIRARLQRFVDQRLYGIKVEFRDGKADKGASADARPLTPFSQGVSEFPAQFGQYEITRLIARGGMGEVYQGRIIASPASQANLALKMLPFGFSTDDEVRQRFIQEAQVIARLDHPNIVHLRDYGEAGQTHFIAMDFIAGQPLNELLKAHGPLPVIDIWSILGDVASALDYAHAQGVVHRDVKPSNIMVQPDGKAVLMDFGLAKLANVSGITRSGVVGTLEYMAPEQISGSTVDGRADIYSLGIVAFELLTGKRPYGGDNPGVIIFGHLQRPAPNPTDFRMDVPVVSAKAVMRAMEKKPTDRFSKAADFVAAGQSAP